ncbi:MAG: hypothetical protein QM765_24390 [Myxococcales bacterium]
MNAGLLSVLAVLLSGCVAIGGRVDTGLQAPDGGSDGEADASGLTDSGNPPVDAGHLGADAGLEPPDATAAGPDAAFAGPDAGAPGACSPLSIAAATVGSYKTDRYSWSDSACRPRSAALVRNDSADPGGSRGGFLREYVYEADGARRTCTAESGLRWGGWGYVVTHYGSGSTSSHDTTGTYRTVFAGAHHAIHEFKVSISPGGPVAVTVHWLFATGRDHPVYSITFDASANAANVLKADTRAPYGNLNFDGIANGSGEVAGVGWGDKFRFTTTGSGPVSMASAWDYSQPNAIPYVVEWSADADAEMGAVETRPFLETIAGGDYGGGMLADCWGRTSANPGPNCVKDAAGDTMFASWLWPYQLNQYELPFVTTSKRLAWGATYSAIGQASYDSLGRTGLSGHPRVSYAVHVVLGEHSAGSVAAMVSEMEAAQATTLTATKGTVATSGLAGAGRTDTMAWSPMGWNHVYGTWDVQSAGNAASLRFSTGAGTLRNPVVRLLGYSGTGPTTVKLAGATLVQGTDWFASVDPAEQVLWLTLRRAVSGVAELSIE